MKNGNIIPILHEQTVEPQFKPSNSCCSGDIL